jgi:hypothetical protein
LAGARRCVVGRSKRGMASWRCLQEHDAASSAEASRGVV